MEQLRPISESAFIRDHIEAETDGLALEKHSRQRTECGLIDRVGVGVSESIRHKGANRRTIVLGPFLHVSQKGLPVCNVRKELSRPKICPTMTAISEARERLDGGNTLVPVSFYCCHP